MAQLVERYVRNVQATSSNLVISTRQKSGSNILSGLLVNKNLADCLIVIRHRIKVDYL